MDSRNAKSDHADQSLSHSMTDLMTSLAVIFILLLVVYMNRSFEETRKGSQNRIEALKSELDQALKAEQIECEYNRDKDPLSCTIRVRDEKLSFDTGKYSLKPSGQRFLSWMIPRLTQVVCDKKNHRDVESIFIQGFTDSDDSDEHNLELSQNRAFQVMLHSLNRVGLGGSERDCLLGMASTNGRGERELLYSSSQGRLEDKRASRRVEFKIRVKSFEQRQHMAQANLSKDVRHD